MKWPILRVAKEWELSRYYPFVITVIFIAVLVQYSFSSLEAFFYDTAVRGDWGARPLGQIVVVTLDEESDLYLGEQYPYTYATHVRFFERLATERPTLVSYIMDLNSPENRSEEMQLERLHGVIEGYTRAGGAFRFGTSMVEGWGEQWPPDRLRDLGHSLALLHVDSLYFAKDEVCRRVVLNISGEESLHTWLVKRVKDSSNLSNRVWGSYYSAEADASFALFRYSANPTERAKQVESIPFHRVVVGDYPKNYFAGKVVLVGSKYLARPDDFVATPFNREDKIQAPRLFVHAQIIESLLQGKTILKLPHSLTIVLCFLLAFVLSYVNSRVNPTRGLIIIVATALLVLVLSYLLFVLFGVWMGVTHAILTIFVVYYIWVPFRAIAEYQTRYAIEEEAKILKQVDNLKQNFISLMSHDLKTPVAKIAATADLLKTLSKPSDEQLVYIHRILESTGELNDFINSILDLVKVESNRLNLQKSSRDINQIIDEVVRNLRPSIEAKKMTIETELAVLYPITIDVNLIKRVISNLVENAIKYAGEGKSIRIITWEDGDWVRVRVEDNGVGIDPENITHIFDKFYRVKNDAHHTIKGSGLGLYLVKYFIELHGGTIIVESTVGQGTAFIASFVNS